MDGYKVGMDGCKVGMDRYKERIWLYLGEKEGIGHDLDMLAIDYSLMV